MINFKRFWCDWAMAFIPTVLILLMVYIFIIYPNERTQLSQYNEVNEIYRELKASTFRFGLIMTVLVSVFVAQVYAVTLDAYKLRFSLPISIPARLKSKAIRNYMVPRSASVGTAFELAFELENNEIKRFNVTADQYSLVFENNRGILTYKEHSKSRFVDFDVQEIDG